VGSDCNWMVGYNLCKHCGARAQAICQVLKVSQLVQHIMRHPDSPFVSVLEFILEQTEETTGAQYTNHHAPELPEDLMPLADANAASTLEVFKDIAKALLSMWRQFEHLSERINHPAQHNLNCIWVAISFQKLLNGCDILSVCQIFFVQWAEDVVYRVQQASNVQCTSCRTPLYTVYQII